MNKEYYSPDVKSYDPMAQEPLPQIDVVIKNSIKGNSYSPEICRKYNPGYCREASQEFKHKNESVHSSDYSFQKIEKRIMNYHPSPQSGNISGWTHTISKKIYKGGSGFARIFHDVIQTINRWLKIFKR